MSPASEGEPPAAVASSAPDPAGSRLDILALVLALGVFAWLVARTSFLIDDAYISFRYAKNWSETGLATYNVGLEPVEGYSNFLWVVLLRLAYDLGFELELAARVLSIGCGAVLLFWVARFLRRELTLAPLARASALVLLAGFPPFATWATGGLETALQTLLAFGAFAMLVRRAAPGRELRSGLLAGLFGLGLGLVRVEGFVWIVVIACVVALAHAITGAGARRAAARPFPLVRLATYLAVSLTGFACFLLWRHAVYGEWLANTAQAKSGLSADVLLRGVKTSASYGILFVTPLVALVVAPWTWRRGRAVPALAAAGLYAAVLGYNVLVGGDWMPMFRFLAPASPFLVLILAAWFDRVGSRVALGVGALLLGLQLLPVFGLSAAPGFLREALYFRTFRIGYETEWERWQRENRNLKGYRQLGQALAQIAAPGDSLTQGAIGAVGYFSGLTMYDRNGLVDREVARREVTLGGGTAGHEKKVPRAFFLSRRPTFFAAQVWPSVLTGSEWPGQGPALRFLAGSVLGDPEEAALLEHALPVLHDLRSEGDLPVGAKLLLLRWTDDPQAAQAFWRRFRSESGGRGEDE